jgi:dipeptidyl aminopeptidase/acylaminoacyl peptidase
MLGLRSKLQHLLLATLATAIAIPLSLAQDVPKTSDQKEALSQFINSDASDTTTKLEVMRQEIYLAEQEAIVTEFHTEYGNRINMRRVLYASGAELIPGYIFTPVNITAGKKYAAVILLHGGFHEKLDWRFFAYIDAAITRGFVVFFPEYRSSRGYGETLYHDNYGVTDIEDVLSGAEYLAKLSYVDPDRMGIIGHSRGGMLTMAALEKDPKRFKAGVEIAGLVDFLAYMSYKPDYRRNEVAQEKLFGGRLPSESLQPYLDISPITHVDDIQSPLFIIGTTADNEVPFTLHGGRMADAMKARGKTFELKLYEKAPGGHVFLFGDTPEAENCRTRAMDFLAKYLRP